ncbi:uncharacterized protein METZ01_LOCUS7477 [marine metagenome]|uniref:DNA polymerase III subunit delta n=1 Tax=marine metagenome TaxID=408172 RepID=A0A381NM69_9ZZZZ
MQMGFDHVSSMNQTGRLPHALMIDGPGGWGEVELAAEIAMMLIERSGDPRTIAHPDFRWIEAENSVVKVDQIRNLIDFIQQTAHLGSLKVVVLEDAQKMNLNAANALLKILEEPPIGSHLILVTEAKDLMLPTVISRCQRVSIRKATREVVVRWLSEQDVAAEESEPLLIEYGGAPFHVLEAVRAERKSLWSALKTARDGKTSVSDVVDGLRNENIVEVLTRWARFLHRLAVEDRVGPDGLDFFDDLIDARRMARSNTGLNRSLQLERLMFKWRGLVILDRQKN